MVCIQRISPFIPQRVTTFVTTLGASIPILINLYGTTEQDDEEEHRRLRAELIGKWKPWEKSTGPKTNEGKVRAATRGFKGGWREQMREIRSILRKQEQERAGMQVMEQ
jgi:hypothetical protein